jgi:hypothetical protein
LLRTCNFTPANFVNKLVAIKEFKFASRRGQTGCTEIVEIIITRILVLRAAFKTEREIIFGKIEIFGKSNFSGLIAAAICIDNAIVRERMRRIIAGAI